jgi:hypothetical protein
MRGGEPMFSPIFIDLVLFVLFLLVIRLILFYLFVGKGVLIH